ncbi:hypothetical protein Pfo_026491 [Paulownia fortunei]|nr:hypothetical protein Pfo_026491 [Paulownia fortunei]
MVFNGSEYCEDPMPILGKLPKLRSLVLCNDAFIEKKMVCSEPDFPQLRSLKLVTLQSLEEWEVEGDMQNLTILTIEHCDKLKELPSGLIKLPTLRKLMIRLTPTEFQDKVKEIGQSDSRLLIPLWVEE